MKQRRKGQAALEFLMTYGWAFLVILIVIGAFVYFDVLNPAGLVPARCSFPAGFSCPEFGISEEKAQFVLTNRQGFSIEFTENVTLISTSTSIQTEYDCELQTGADLNKDFDFNTNRLIEGRSLLFECNIDEENFAAGERFQGNILVKFKRAGGAIDQQARGSIGAEITE